MRDVHDDEPVDRVQERLKDRFIDRISRADDEHVGGNRQTGHERGQARSGADVEARDEYRREEEHKRSACPRQRREENTQRKRGYDRAECDEITRNGVSRQAINFTLIGGPMLAQRGRARPGTTCFFTIPTAPLPARERLPTPAAFDRILNGTDSLWLPVMQS